MPITVNGFPKCGNHAVKKGIELLGVTEVGLVHEPHLTNDLYRFDGPMVMPLRHPRNVLLSRCRWDGRECATGFLQRLMRQWENDGEPRVSMAAAYRAYLPWRFDTRVLTVRYEDLIATPAVLQQIAGFLKVPYLDDAFPHLPGLTYSWNPVPSRWEDVWNETLDQTWVEEGLQDLQTSLGYV